MILPIEGMTCASCVSNIEGALMKVQGVSEANVDLASERAKIVSSIGDLELSELVQAVKNAGYDVPLERLQLPIGGMTCVSCAAHVEGALSDVPGVAEVNVNLATEKAAITYIPGTTELPAFAEAVRRVGFEVIEAPADIEAGHED